MKKQLLILFSLLMLNTVIAEQVKPIKVLMITGGGWHDYKTQAPLLKKTLESQINATVDIKWTSTKEHPVKPKTEVLPQIMATDSPRATMWYFTIIAMSDLKMTSKLTKSLIIISKIKLAWF